MKFVTYILKDDSGRFYKGATNNLHRRLGEHKGGSTKSTRYMKNIAVVYTEEFETFAEARKRELYFKFAAGRKFIKKLGL